MRRRELITLLGGAAAAWPFATSRCVGQVVMTRPCRPWAVVILRRAILILLSVFLMTATAHAQAEATAQEFLDKSEQADATERQTVLILIKGLAEGVAWADASNEARGVARLHCPPGHFFSLQPEQLMDILRSEVEARPVMRQEPWQRASIEALRNVFPCRPQRGQNIRR